MEKPAVGEFLATLRKEDGYTQQDVADKLNISDRTLSSWETGRTEPDLSSLAALADFYGLTVDEILRGERNAERHTTACEQPEESEDPLEKFFRKRNICVAVGVISALVFIIGSLTLLLTEAPLWLDLLFILAGAAGNIASLVLLFRFESRTLGDDAENELKLNLKHSASFALIFNSLAYICGAIVLFICFFTTDTYRFTEEITDVIVWLNDSESYDYAYTAFSLICLFAGLILLAAGTLKINVSAKYLGSARQKFAAKYNVKLFNKLCLFGAIPVVLSCIFFVIFSFVKFSAVDEVYFTANGVDELRKTFQTLTFEVDQTYSEDGTVMATIPAGEYYLNFENEKYVECKVSDSIFTYTKLLCDLGNGFYGDFYIWNVRYYHLKDGVSADGITCENDFDDCFIYIGTCSNVDFTSPDGKRLTTYAVAYSCPDSTRREWSQGYGELYYSTSERALTRSGSVYTYQRIVYYDYSPLAGLILGVVSTATVLTCTAIQLVKRKKIK